MSSAKTRVPRPARPAVPSLPSFESLDLTHRHVMQALAKLSTLEAHLEANGVDDTARRMAGEICRFFDGTAQAHHLAEESFVFPRLLNGSDALLIHHVHRLQQDHGWIEQNWLELAPMLRAIAEGEDWVDPEEMQHAMQVFLTLCHDHIMLEETLIYPAAKGQLAQELARRAG